MARIKNIELPNEKHVCIGLTAIYGIGRSLALTICENAKVEPTKKIKELTDDEIIAIKLLAKEKAKEIKQEKIKQKIEKLEKELEK